MKKLIYLVSLTTLGIFLIFIYAGCSEESSPVATTTVVTTTVVTTTVPTNATITGVGSLPPGVPGSISNTRVALYISQADWAADATFAFVACDASGNYTLSNIVPGTYYMDAWKDNNANFIWGDSGDYIWWNGSGAWPATLTLSPLQFTAGSNSKDFQVFLVP
ncbi:MAG: hypothetical protein HKM87_01555 [Ignavibacteriaceae bacterium]|nr:hypothetical protein [Ignavibacteriaceae bacterium]